MLGSFIYDNPTRIYFGEDSLDHLSEELAKYGPVVQLVFGGGSIRKTGLYDKVTAILAGCSKKVVLDGGVMPNPTVERVQQGIAKAREEKTDLLLAVGGGSCCDYAKAVAAGAWFSGDLWEECYMGKKPLPYDQNILPVGCILTMAGTGSEMNGTAVLTSSKSHDKRGCKFGPRLYPKFSILNPVFTYTLPKYQMAAGIYDIFCHICEQYFSGEDDNTSDYIAEGLMRSLLTASRAALANPQDYAARSNIMWTASWALNSLLGLGKKGDWMLHKMGHAVSAWTNATHGMTLACVTLPYYRFVLPFGLAKFKRFAMNVFSVRPEGKTDMETASQGLKCLESWMKELGAAMHLSELGVGRDMLDDIAKSVIILDAGYKKLTRGEVRQILESAL